MKTTRRHANDGPERPPPAEGQPSDIPSLGAAAADILMSTTGRVTSAIARDILARGPGQLLPISEYAGQLGVGTGTVQAAFALLRDMEAVVVEARVRRGSSVTAMDIGRLWRIAMGRPIAGCVPMPYSRIFEGIATGISESLRRYAIQAHLVHVDGSKDRISKLVEEECDFCIVSTLAADIAREDDIDVEQILALGRGSFILKHVLIRRRGQETPATIGVDPTSLDQQYITQAIFGEDPHVRFKETRYYESEREFLNGSIDAMVWHSDDAVSIRAPELEKCPLPAGVAKRLAHRNTEAAILIRPHDNITRTVLRSTLEPTMIRRIQARIVRGLRAASY